MGSTSPNLDRLISMAALAAVRLVLARSAEGARTRLRRFRRRSM
jgi:hypothetical protein